MKKNKILITAIIAIAVVFIGIIAAMFATGKFSSLKNNFGDNDEVTATVTEASTLPQSQVSRPKSQRPDTVVAATYSSYSENSALELSLFESNGFNTVIFNLTKDNAQSVAGLLAVAEKNRLYYGVKADVSASADYVLNFAKENNINFIILSGNDETIAASSELTGRLCTDIKAIDSLILIGIEPVYTSKVSPSLTELIAGRCADFIFVSHEKGNDSAFKAAQQIWNEESSPLWLCHDLGGLSGYSAENAENAIELISVSADMSMCKGLAFSSFEEIANASGKGADAVKEYIIERDSYLLNKEFSITNHKSTSITVEQSRVTFRGTSSPLSELKCNGQVLTVAKNGDFSVDCELNPGENTIKFEHKGKTHIYKVTYKIKLLKSVSPSADISVPGGMLVEVSAVALKNAAVTVSFNGKNYKMTPTGGNGEDAPDSSSDFTTFTASLETPESTSKIQKLGKYKVTAKYSSLSESLNGANVNVTAIEIIEPTPEPPSTQAPTTTQPLTQAPTTLPATNAESTVATGTQVNTSSTQEQSQSATQAQTDAPTQATNPPVGDAGLEKYYYTNNYGLGSAKICEIIDDYVETYPANTSSTVSVPDCSPLLKGTADYVKNSVTLDGDKYYILASGVRVPLISEERLASGQNGKITHLSIKDGYVMPKNSIKVLSCSVSGGDTVIILAMNRAVAFNAKLTGQTYGMYNNRPVSVSSLDCKGLEFTFSDTVTAEGTFSFANSVIGSATWSSDSSKSTVTLSMTLANPGKFYGFHYEYDESGNLIIKIKNKPSSSLSGYTIMLDPGHGGLDSGAVCAVSSSSYGQEKHINLSIATKVKELLEAEGATVLMTRSSDKWVCYADRNGAVRDRNPDMFISIHCDSSTAASAMGTSAFYYRAYSQPLAKAIHNSIVDTYKNDIYKDKSAGLKNEISRGASFYAFRVARVEQCPAILIEYGFVSNTAECQVLQTAANRDKLAAATVKGIKDYIAVS